MIWAGGEDKENGKLKIESWSPCSQCLRIFPPLFRDSPVTLELPLPLSTRRISTSLLPGGVRRDFPPHPAPHPIVQVSLPLPRKFRPSKPCIIYYHSFSPPAGLALSARKHAAGNRPHLQVPARVPSVTPKEPSAGLADTFYNSVINFGGFQTLLSCPKNNFKERGPLFPLFLFFFFSFCPLFLVLKRPPSSILMFEDLSSR